MWTCVRTHPNAEQIAIRNLVNQDFSYYQPKIMERKLRKGKVTQVVTPLFPCYLFVEVVNKWMCLNSTHGISSVLMMGASPSIVQDRVIDDLKQRERNGIIQLPKKQRFEQGDKVTIQAGPFAGQQGLVERMSNKEREKVLLNLLSNKVKVLIAEIDLDAA